MKRIIKLTVFLVLVSLVLFVVGSQVMAASNVLRLITWSGYAPEELIAKFKAETGIEVQVILSNNC
jgi:spermidine/putrescine transport system substrate-binding protein